MYEKFFDGKGHRYAGLSPEETPGSRRFKGGGKGGSAPAPAPAPRALPAPPERSDEKTASLADAQRRKSANSKTGRASTFLSGGSTTQGASAVRFLGGSSKT